MILYSHWCIHFPVACEYGFFFFIGEAVDLKSGIAEIGVHPDLLIPGLGKAVASKRNLA